MDEDALVAEQLRLRDTFLVTDDCPNLNFDPASLNGLHCVAGVDVSFTSNNETAFASACALSFPDLTLLRSVVIQHDNPAIGYIPGLLGFREARPCVDALNELQSTHVIGCVLVDGNGTLHSRRFGSACHIGVLSGLPTIGVAKNIMCIDGLNRPYVEHRATEALCQKGAWERVYGSSGAELCALVQATGSSKKPVIVSQGHRFSLSTSARIAAQCMHFKTPEPIRAADMASRKALARAPTNTPLP